MTAKTRVSQTHEEFVAARKKFVGGSDIASVKNVGRYACSRRLGYDKLGYPKDVDDSDRMEFRRGHRLEGIAADYYTEKTGRETWFMPTVSVPGRPHLSVNIDRLVKAEGKKGNGYLEIKVLSRHSWFKVKKEGLIEDYILQMQYGCAVAALEWGSYAIYSPDLDELMYFDVDADRELGEHLLEAADDWWNFHVGCRVLPDPLPEGSKQCFGCPWEITCRGFVGQAAGDAIAKPDLEGVAAKMREVKGMEKEAGDAAEGLRDEIVEAIGRKPGNYLFGRFPATFTGIKRTTLDQAALAKDHPDIYKKYLKESVSETLKIREPKE